MSSSSELSQREPEPAVPVRPPRLSTGAVVLVALLLGIPCLALALVVTYSSETPKLWGFPFFYWYQLMWVILTPLFTWSAYLVVKRGRAQR